MRVGSLCYATDQGLGILAKSFYDNGIITDVVVVEHAHRPTHGEWFPGAERHHIRHLKTASLRGFCKSVDVMLFLETPFVWEIIPYCREIEVKTLLMTMYECCPPVAELPYQPDAFMCPSLLDRDYYPDRSVYIPIPVDVPYRQRTRADVFVHNAGYGGLKGRNGTADVIQSLPLVKTPCALILRTQKGLAGLPRHSGKTTIGHVTVDYRIGTVQYSELYTEGDVFIFPERFNGLSLPLQEAYASGMTVIATDRYPMNTWLPQETLIRPTAIRPNRVSGRCNEFQEALVDPKDLAAMIDRLAGTDITAASLKGKEWAEKHSWNVLRPKYLQFLQGVKTGGLI